MEDTKPPSPLHIVIKERKAIRKIWGYLASGNFAATDRIHPETAPGQSNEVLHFIVTTNRERKIAFTLIQGDDLLIPKLLESESSDPDFILPLGKFLLELQRDRETKH